MTNCKTTKKNPNKIEETPDGSKASAKPMGAVNNIVNNKDENEQIKALADMRNLVADFQQLSTESLKLWIILRSSKKQCMQFSLSQLA